MSEYLLLIGNSATSAAAIASTGQEGAEHQIQHLESLGIRTIGQWLALGIYDQVLILEGTVESILAYQFAAQLSDQEVQVVPLVDTKVASDVVALLEGLPGPEPE